MKRRYRIPITMFAAYVLLVVPTGLMKGCASSKLPSKLSKDQKTELRSVRLPAIGVERYEYPAYSDSLKSNLTRTGLFEKVGFVDEFKTPPDLIAKVENRIYGRAVIPVLTGASLGLIPTWEKEEHGESFSISHKSRLGQKLLIDFRYSGNTILGWPSGLCNLLIPDRTDNDVNAHPQYAEALGYAIAQKKGEIAKFLEK